MKKRMKIVRACLVVLLLCVTVAVSPASAIAEAAFAPDEQPLPNDPESTIYAPDEQPMPNDPESTIYAPDEQPMSTDPESTIYAPDEQLMPTDPESPIPAPTLQPLPTDPEATIDVPTIQPMSAGEVPTIEKVMPLFPDGFTLYLFTNGMGEDIENVGVVLVDDVEISFKFTTINGIRNIKIFINKTKYVGTETIALRWANAERTSYSNIVYYDLNYKQLRITGITPSFFEATPTYKIDYISGYNPLRMSYHSILFEVHIRVKGQANQITIVPFRVYGDLVGYIQEIHTMFQWHPINGTYEITVTDSWGRTSAPYEIVINKPVAEIESITPQYINNEKEGPTLITIKGQRFNSDQSSALTVRFGNINITQFESVSSTEISFYAPTSNTGVYNVRVTNASGVPSNDLQVTIEKPVLEIFSYSPSLVSVYGENMITIYGKHFETIESIDFAGKPQPNDLVITNTMISFTMPNYEDWFAEAVDIKLTNKYGSAVATFRLISSLGAPEITSVSPTVIPYSGIGTTKVTITGTNLHRLRSLVYGWDTPVDFEVISDTEIVFWPSGNPMIVLTFCGIYGIYSKTSEFKITFSYPPAPVITSVSDQTVINDEWIEIKGKNFDYVTSIYVIHEDDPQDSAHSIFLNYRRIDGETFGCQLPATLKRGNYNLCLLTSFLQGSNEVMITKLFATPTIDNIAPIHIPIGTGTTAIKIESKSFSENLGNLDAFRIELYEPGSMVIRSGDAEVVWPSGGTPSMELKIENQAFPKFMEVTLVYTRDGFRGRSEPVLIEFYAPNPILTSYSADIVENDTANVLIDGRYLVNVEKVELDGEEVPFKIINSEQFALTLPSAVIGSQAKVVVTTATGTSNALTLGYQSAAPSITGASPDTVPILGGKVTLTGENFINITSVTMRAGPTEIDMPFTCMDGQTIIFDAPPQSQFGDAVDAVALVVKSQSAVSNVWLLQYDDTLPYATLASSQFDKHPGSAHHKDIVATLTLNGYTLQRITLAGVVLTAGTDYSFSSDKVAFSSAYLKTLDLGQHTFILEMSGNVEVPITVTVSNSAVAVTGVSLNIASATLKVGSTLLLAAQISPQNATDITLSWTSNNPAIASVDDTGKVTAHFAGSATITVRTNNGGFTATCNITVLAPTTYMDATGVSLNRTSAQLPIGDTLKLTATVSPGDASEKGVTWTSSDSSIASVDGNGNVLGIKAGVATITVTSRDGGFTATCKVTVYEGVPETGDDASLALRMVFNGTFLLLGISLLVWRKKRQGFCYNNQ